MLDKLKRTLKAWTKKKNAVERTTTKISAGFASLHTDDLPPTSAQLGPVGSPSEV
jgi:hypothetical protein